MVSNSFVIVHGPESEKTTNRLYVNQYTTLKGKFVTQDLEFGNKLESIYHLFICWNQVFIIVL